MHTTGSFLYIIIGIRTEPKSHHLIELPMSHIYMYIHIHLYLFHIPTSLACFLSPPVSFSHSKRQLTLLYLLLHLHVLYTPYITEPTDLVLFLISSFLVINGIKTRYYDRTKKGKGMQRFIMSRYLIR